MRSSLSASRNRFCLPPAVLPLFLPSLPAMFSGAWRRPLIRPSLRSLPLSPVPSQSLLAYLPRFCLAPFYRDCVTLPRSGERTAVAAAKVTLTMPALDRNTQAIKQSIYHIHIRCMHVACMKCFNIDVSKLNCKFFNWCVVKFLLTKMLTKMQLWNSWFFFIISISKFGKLNRRSSMNSTFVHNNAQQRDLGNWNST